MKLKEYEKSSVLITLVIVLFIFIIILLLYAFFKKTDSYLTISGVVRKENLVEMLVIQDELDVLVRNKYLYFEGEKIEYKIESVVRNILKKDNKSYHDVLISLESLKNLKENDSIDFNFGIKKESLLERLEIIWKGD